MNDLDRALSNIDDLTEILGCIEDRVDNARDDLDRLRKLLDPAIRLIPPAARTFEVTDDDVDTAVREYAYSGGPGRDALRAALIGFAAHLAGRTEAGGPEVTDADLVDSHEVLQAAGRDRRDILTAILEHDRARIWARTSGGVA